MLTVYIALVVLVDIILALHTINYTHHRYQDQIKSCHMGLELKMSITSNHQLKQYTINQLCHHFYHLDHVLHLWKRLHGLQKVAFVTEVIDCQVK